MRPPNNEGRFAAAMRRLRASLFLLALLGPAVHADDVLTLVSTDYPPYFSSKLPEQGTLSALVRAAFLSSGHQIKLEFRPWARLMAEVQAGKYHGVVAVWYSDERAAFLAYSDPLVDTHIGFYGRNDQNLKVDNLATLRDKLVGTVRGYANPAQIAANQLRTEDAVDDLTNLKKLAAGRLDLVVIDRALADWLLRENLPGALTHLAWRDPPLQTMPLYIGFARKNPGYQRLLADFNRGLAEIRRNGEYARIMKRLPLVRGARPM
ncbi:transporter substrate-binding domain-containing protein [Chitinimonas arctica]|uniref:Transporter substrate-binding domain-containing protein n=2 Tax=Chitinimonas arctica TaxID=2594795 RepID=A0A516SMQ0_9NEIS|nr:transporter substrate-binding domain-containing protein [Chitinimonas arctica]